MIEQLLTEQKNCCLGNSSSFDDGNSKDARSKDPIQGVAVLPDDNVPAKQLFQRGAKAVVRQGKDGMAAILSRKAQESGISVAKLNRPSTSNGSFIRWIPCKLWCPKPQKTQQNLRYQIIGKANSQTHQGGQAMTGKTCIRPKQEQEHR